MRQCRLLPGWLFLAAGALVVPPCALDAGQSLVMTNGMNPLNFTDPLVSVTDSWRIEFQIHNWTLPAAGVYTQKLFGLSGIGISATLAPDNTLQIGDFRDNITEQAPCIVTLGKLTNALVRIQRDVSQKQFTCEIWSYDSTGYNSQVRHITSPVAWTYTDGAVGMGANASLGFFRASKRLVPMGGRPPVTADTGDWTELKFDGNLKDSSGHGHGGSGGGVYMATPNQEPIPFPKTLGAPAWSPWVALRAGFPAQLDGTTSYSLADKSSSVTYQWQKVKGGDVVWSDRTSGTPTITGLVFGTYTFSLQVQDAAGVTKTATLDVGAVATDNNGVVVNADPNVDKIFGPMIAFGRNPWGYADERAIAATKLRSAAYIAQGLAPPSWEKPQPGTVSYIQYGANGVQVGTLAAPVPDAHANTISVADAAAIDLANLPTRILIGPIYGQKEEIRVCAASALTGPATLTVCYDGRGIANPQGETYRRPAKNWDAGSPLWQLRVKGTGTNFLSTLCPAGPGPAGPVLYTAGTVTLSPGSPAVVGSGAKWGPATGIYPNSMLRVTATHGGIPFVFSAYATGVADATHLTLSRPYPADADAGTFSYSLLLPDQRELTMHYARGTDGSDAQTFFFTSGCESDTDMYVFLSHDFGVNPPLHETGKQYSYMDGFGYVSAYGANFYGEDLAHRALYYRSGWQPALDAARVMGDNFVRSPQVAGGDAGGLILLQGGGAIGGFASAILDADHAGHTSWSDLRSLANWGAVGSVVGCNADDSRDTGYFGAMVALAAEFDPDPAQRTQWKARLRDLYARELRCKGADNSWAHGGLWNPQYPLQVTNGSAIATGTNLPPAMCFGIASGTITVTKGSATATINSGAAVAGSKITVNATLAGQPYVSGFEFSFSGSTVNLAAFWPGDSGTFPFLIENNSQLTSIGTGNDDPQLKKNWACTWNNASQITLNRPWDGPTEANAFLYSYGLTGFGQQPFMLGIKTTELKYASQNDDATLAAGFASLASLAAGWIHDVGYDPATQGMHYGRIFQACEPETTPPPNSSFASRQPVCNYGLDPGAIRAARALNSEVSQALRVYYESNPTAEAKAWGDKVYGAVWGYAPYTTGNVYSDPYYVKDENADVSLGAYKWTGFFFGMGMAHQWPAARLGGVAAPLQRTVTINVDRNPGGTAEIRVTAPSGAKQVFPCGADPACVITVDDRQGSHWYQVHYISATGQEPKPSDPILLAMPR